MTRRALFTRSSHTVPVAAAAAADAEEAAVSSAREAMKAREAEVRERSERCAAAAFQPGAQQFHTCFCEPGRSDLPWAFRPALLDEAGARGMELEDHNFMARFHAG